MFALRKAPASTENTHMASRGSYVPAQFAPKDHPESQHVLTVTRPLVNTIQKILPHDWVQHELNTRPTLPKEQHSAAIYILPHEACDPTFIPITSIIFTEPYHTLHRLTYSVYLEFQRRLDKSSSMDTESLMEVAPPPLSPLLCSHTQSLLSHTLCKKQYIIPETLALPPLSVLHVPRRTQDNQESSARALCSAINHSSSRLSPSIVAVQSNALDSDVILKKLFQFLEVHPCPPIILVWGRALRPNYQALILKRSEGGRWPLFPIFTNMLLFLSLHATITEKRGHDLRADTDAMHRCARLPPPPPPAHPCASCLLLACVTQGCLVPRSCIHHTLFMALTPQVASDAVITVVPHLSVFMGLAHVSLVVKNSTADSALVRHVREYAEWRARLEEAPALSLSQNMRNHLTTQPLPPHTKHIWAVPRHISKQYPLMSRQIFLVSETPDAAALKAALALKHSLAIYFPAADNDTNYEHMRGFYCLVSAFRFSRCVMDTHMRTNGCRRIRKHHHLQTTQRKNHTAR